MSNRVNTSKNLSFTNPVQSGNNLNIGIVVDVILDETHKRLKQTDEDILFSTGVNTLEVGYCVIRPLNDQVTAENNLIAYAPYDLLNLDLPLIGETVEIKNIGNRKFYKRITSDILNRGNAAKPKQKYI